ncbi:MAG: YfhO family protein [Anaerolineae bacterium]
MFFVLIAILLVAAWFGLWWARRHSRLPEDWDRDVLCTAVLGLLTVGFFWRPLLAGDVWMPADGGDLASFLYPTYRFAADSLRQGFLPLWNPYLYGGMPFIGDIQSGLLYPVYLLFYALTPAFDYHALEWLVALHFFLAGTNMYLFLRFLRRREHPDGRLRRLACLAGAVAFMFSDFFIVHFGNLNMIAVAAWMPLVFLLFHRAVEDQRSFLAAWSGIILGTATLAGHIQITLFIALVLAFWAAWEMGSRWRRHFPWRSVLLPALYLLVTGATAFGISASALLPFFQHAGFTQRTAWSYSQTVQYSFAPGQFISLLVPTFFGRGPALHWGIWDRVETGYIGILPLLLAVAGVLLYRRKMGRFLLALAVGGFVMAMGLYALLHGWLYQLVPGMGQLRAPARFIVMFDFAVAGLCALGLDALLRPMPRRRRAVLARWWHTLPWLGLSAVLAVWCVVYLALLLSQDKDPTIFLRLSVSANGAGLFTIFVLGSLALLAARRYGRIRPAALGILSVALIFFDLSSTGSYIDLGTKDPTETFHHPEIISFLKSDSSLYRIDARTGIDQFWQPDTALLYGLYDVSGIVNPLLPRDTARYWDGLGSRSTRLYDALNVKYVIAAKDVELDWSRFVPVFDGDPQLNVYLNTRALPRAWVVHEVVTAGDHEQAYALIHAPDFEPAQAAVVEGGAEVEPAAGADEVHILEMHPNCMILRVRASSKGILVLGEVFYPGWKAWVNGKLTKVLRANYLFRAVAVPAGESQVVLCYSPLTWWAGVACTTITVVGLVAAQRIGRRRKGRPRT